MKTNKKIIILIIKKIFNWKYIIIIIPPYKIYIQNFIFLFINISKYN